MDRILHVSSIGLTVKDNRLNKQVDNVPRVMQLENPGLTE